MEKKPLETKRLLLDYCPAKRIFDDERFAGNFTMFQKTEEMKTQDVLIPEKKDLGTIKACKCSGVLKQGVFLNAEKSREITHTQYDTPYTKSSWECCCIISYQKGIDIEKIKEIFQPGVKALY
ncbi:MAG TPA: hypothetical protein ENI34_09095 [candidate division WOR-3 bacterium]|uniref:Uncharacterized protein n=1 Tax=candidate division WOR-3 bacterium TaxID=2052148 RepID=A0A9C9EP29_UNCW3|nr:hypothetical protein [candidate division WOR-3 bacterium]